MVTYELKKDAKLTDSEREALKKAKSMPVIYDDDSPEMTREMEQAFIAARKKKPFSKEPLTLYVSRTTIEKAKSLGGDYIAILGHLLDQAVTEYKAM